MKKIVVGIFTVFLLSSCLWDEETQTKHLTKDFNLGWWSEPRYRALFKNSDSTKYGGAVLIPETVFAVGFNDNIIIAKQHPNKQEEISARLFNRDSTGYYRLSNPADTVYIWSGDSIFRKNGHWYHISNGWNPPDSLFPYKKKTNYYIIDISDSKKNTWNSKERVYKYTTESDFKEGRKNLGVPDELKFNFLDRELE